MNPKNEPVLSAGLVIGLAEAIITVLTTFGVSVTPDQSHAVIGLIGAVIAVGAAVYPILKARANSTPNSKVVEAVHDGTVFAGEASEKATGEMIRKAGSLNETSAICDCGKNSVASA